MTGAAPTTRALDWSVLDQALVAVVLVVAWQLLFLLVGDVAIASPLQAVRHVARLFQNEAFWGNVQATARAFGYSFAIASVAGVVLGLALGFHRFSGRVAEPILTSIYTVPKVTLYPLVLLVFGLGIPAKVAFGVMHGLLPAVLFTMGAVRAMNPVHRKTARVLSLTPLQTAVHILAPAVIPEIATGLRVCFSLTLLGVLVGEMFASRQGLGFMIVNSINTHDVNTITAVILLLISFAVVANAALLAVDRFLHSRA